MIQWLAALFLSTASSTIAEKGIFPQPGGPGKEGTSPLLIEEDEIDSQDNPSDPADTPRDPPSKELKTPAKTKKDPSQRS